MRTQIENKYNVHSIFVHECNYQNIEGINCKITERNKESAVYLSTRNIDVNN